MADEKNINRKMNVTVIPFVLSLYIILGIAAIVIYAVDTGLIGEQEPKVVFTPVPYSTESGTADEVQSSVDEEAEDYDTAGGTAGAARDF
ncbi:MAG: hypothetical protein J6X66_06015 [Lachnospiraceae bacterium]|nr:hypothetical protein [Lachnospiraceae bacterium]